MMSQNQPNTSQQNTVVKFVSNSSAQKSVNQQQKLVVVGMPTSSPGSSGSGYVGQVTKGSFVQQKQGQQQQQQQQQMVVDDLSHLA